MNRAIFLLFALIFLSEPGWGIIPEDILFNLPARDSCESLLAQPPVKSAEGEEQIRTIADQKSAAEFILFLSYDHPLFERWLERSNSTEDVEALLHLVWGYTLPIYVDPKLRFSNGIKIGDANPFLPAIRSYKTFKQAYSAYIDGRFQYPVDQLQFQVQDSNAFMYASQKQSEQIIHELHSFYLQASDWKIWKELNVEHRKKLVTGFLSSLSFAFPDDTNTKRKFLDTNSMVDPRTGQQNVYMTTFTRASLDFIHSRINSTVLVKRGAQLNSFLPEEIKKFRTLMSHVTNPYAKSYPLVFDYLVDHFPLMLQRRMEAITALDLVGLQKRALTDFSTMRSAKKRVFAADPRTANDAPGYLKSIPLHELKAKLQTPGLLQARIRGDMSLLSESPELLHRPSEMQTTPVEAAKLIESQPFDLSKQLLLSASDQIVKSTASAQIKLDELPIPNTEGLKSVVDVHRYGQMLFIQLNQISMALGAVNTERDQSFSLLLGSQMDTRSAENLLEIIGPSLSQYKILQSNTLANIYWIDEILQKFIANLEEHLKLLQDFQNQIADSESSPLHLAVVEKIEELQSILLLAKSQMQISIQLKKENQQHLSKILRDLLLQIAALNTQKSLKPLSSIDLQDFRDSLQKLQHALAL